MHELILTDFSFQRISFKQLCRLFVVSHKRLNEAVMNRRRFNVMLMRFTVMQIVEMALKKKRPNLQYK